MCHLLAAWTLKLPLWPSDLTSAAVSGTLPFLGAAHAYRDELEGHKYAMRAMRDPLLQTVNVVIAKAQALAASVKMVVPELNLGEPLPSPCWCFCPVDILLRSLTRFTMHYGHARWLYKEHGRLQGGNDGLSQAVMATVCSLFDLCGVLCLCSPDCAARTLRVTKIPSWHCSAILMAHLFFNRAVACYAMYTMHACKAPYYASWCNRISLHAYSLHESMYEVQLSLYMHDCPLPW